MFEQIKSKLTALQGNSATKGHTATGPGNSDGNGASPDQQTSSHLFRCPSCEAVYIAQIKETCGTCGTEVTRVRSTLQNRSHP